MRPQQILVTWVQDFLRNNRDIEVSIPALHNLIDTKINLKVTTQHLPQSFSQAIHYQKEENRYRILMQYIEYLFSTNNLNLQAIDIFMVAFNSTINNDVEIMQRNETTRANTFKVKEKLLFRINQISKRTHLIKFMCEKLHDKEDILSFIAIDMKNYLSSMKLITDQYEGVGKAQVQTPLKIDEIYEYESSTQEDYQSHYNPLLQVLVRLKANVNNLHEQVKNASRIQMPLKSVNLLANCKNLLLELEPFLITDQCAFNRLIFHVVTQQTQNMRLISSFYKYQLDFVKSLVYNVFKCVFLGHIFSTYYNQIKNSIEEEKKKILEHISKINIGTKTQKSAQMTKNVNRLGQNLSKIEKEIKEIECMICFGKTNILQHYLEQKICKKLQLLLEQKSQLLKLQASLKQGNKIGQEVKKIEEQTKLFPMKKKQIMNDIEAINKFSLLNVAMDNKKSQLQVQQLFRKDYLLIQDKLLIMSKIQTNLDLFAKTYNVKQFIDKHFSQIQTNIKMVRKQYTELQANLMKSYEQLLIQKQKKQTKAAQTYEQTLRQIKDYLLNEEQTQSSVYSAMGGDILNQDEQCFAVKQLLASLDKAQYFAKNSERMKNATQELKKLQKYRKFLQWLLIMFEGSMDESIFQSIIDKMDFNEADQGSLQKNVAKVNQLLTETQKYNKAVKKIVLQIQLRDKTKQEGRERESLQIENEIYNKIFKIAKQRLMLYQIIEILYSEGLSVYCDLKIDHHGKSVNLYDIETKGVKLFDKSIYQQVLLYYHCFNKMDIVGQQINDAGLSPKTKNYIIDDIYEPFVNRLNSFVKYNQADMLNLALRLEKAIEIQKNYKSAIKLWKQIAERSTHRSQTLKQHAQKLKDQSKVLIAIGEEMNKILDLSKSKFVVLNIEQIKKISEQLKEYLQIANEIDDAEDLDQVCSGHAFKNEDLNGIVKQIHKTFAAAIE